MAAVQRHALGAAAVGAAIQLGYALSAHTHTDTHRNGVNLPEKHQCSRVFVPVSGESHPLLSLNQLRRKILVELLLPHVSGFDLHAVLQHVDVVGLSVHCSVTTRLKGGFRGVIFYSNCLKMFNVALKPGQRSKPSSCVERFCC